MPYLDSFAVRISYINPTRNLCNFMALFKSMRILRFLVFFVFTVSNLLAQQTSLSKFSIQKATGDGQYVTLEGMRNQTGQVIIPAEYDYIWDFQNDSLTLARKLVLTSTTSSYSILYQIISNSGFLNYEFPNYLIPENIYDGLLRTFNEKTQKFGYVDVQGEVQIKFKFDAARDFKENLAAVQDPTLKKWGFINKKGQYIIKPQFTEAYSFSEGYAIVKLDSNWNYLKNDGSLISITGKYEQVFDLKEGFSVVTQLYNDTLIYGFIDKSGTEILKPKYIFLDNFDSGTAVFIENNEAGMINNAGKVVIEPRYDEVYRFDQAHYLFQINGLKGLLDLDGNIVLPAAYSAIDWFSEGLCAVNRAGKWGFADVQGNEVIPCQFVDYKSGFKNGNVDVSLPDRFYLIHGYDTLSLPDYDEVLPYYGYAAAFRKGNLWGFLNQKGEEAIEPKFDELVYNKGAVVFGRTSQSDGSFLWSVIDPLGREIQFERYNEVVRFTEGLAAVKTRNGWGFVNKSGAEIVSPQFELVRNFSSGRAAVFKNNEWAFINEKGIEVVPAFTHIPVFEESIPKSFSDSLIAIRESFPLYKMQVIGDFNGTCACIEDETSDNISSHPLCMNKIGKIHQDQPCIPYTRKADLFEPEAELNPTLHLIRQAGKWLTIDKSGNVINELGGLK